GAASAAAAAGAGAGAGSSVASERADTTSAWEAVVAASAPATGSQAAAIAAAAAATAGSRGSAKSVERPAQAMSLEQPKQQRPVLFDGTMLLRRLLNRTPDRAVARALLDVALRYGLRARLNTLCIHFANAQDTPLTACVFTSAPLAHALLDLPSDYAL